MTTQELTQQATELNVNLYQLAYALCTKADSVAASKKRDGSMLPFLLWLGRQWDKTLQGQDKSVAGQQIWKDKHLANLVEAVNVALSA